MEVHVHSWRKFFPTTQSMKMARMLGNNNPSVKSDDRGQDLGNCLYHGDTNMNRSSDKKKTPQVEPDFIEMRNRLEMLESRVYAAKVAHLNRTPLDGKEITYEDLAEIARQYIQASYALQKAKFGSVKVKMSIAKLLR
jgi:hypothetical protein